MTDSIDDSSSTPEVTEILPPEPTDEYKGRTYRIYNSFANEGKYINTDMSPDEMTGDALNDALYKRTHDVEDRLGITVEVTKGNQNNIMTLVNAGDDFADITYQTLSGMMGKIAVGAAYDLTEIATIELDKPWWDQNAREKLSINGKLYYTFNDSIMTGMDNCRAVFYNKDIAEELQLDNLYDIVRDGKWTIDYMFNIAKGAVKDLNGDTNYTTEDRFGVTSWGWVGGGEALMAGCDGEFIRQGDDGLPYFNAFTVKFTDVYTKVLDCMRNDNVYINGAEFKDGKALFLVNAMNNIMSFRDMDNDFGVLPVPKYDEAQENYYCISPNPHALLIPITVQDVDFAGRVAEEMAYQSNKTLLKAYYEYTLKGKATRDDDSIEMLDLIHSSLSYVIKIVTDSFADSIYNQLGAGNYEISSTLATWKPKVEAEMEEIIDKIK